MANNVIEIIIRAVDEASEALRRVRDSAGAMATATEAAMRGVTTVVASTTAAISGLGALSLKAGMEFEQAFQDAVVATNGATASFEELKNQALEYGANTKYSATEAAQAIEMLGRNGIDASQILDGALKSSLDLAAAGNVDLSTAADIATSAMLQFKKPVSELPEIVNLITGATANSKFTVEDFGYAMAQAGGVAGSVGVDFDEFATVIALTSSSFDKGGDAGTSFKTFLATLTGTTKDARAAMADLGMEFFNADGSMKSMAGITSELEQGFAGLSDKQKISTAQTIFGTDAWRTALGLADAGVEAYGELATAIGNVDAGSMAAQRMDTLKGAMDTLQGASQTLLVKLYDQGGLGEWARQAVEATTQFVDTLNSNDELIVKFGNTISTVFEAAKTAITTAVNIIKEFLGGWMDANSELSSDWDDVGQAIRRVWEFVLSGAQAAWSVLEPLLLSVVDVINGDFSAAWQGIKVVIRATFESVNALTQDALDELKARFEGATTAFGSIWTGLEPYIARAVESINLRLEALPGTATAIFNALGSTWEQLKPAWDAIAPYAQVAFNAVFDVADAAFVSIKPLLESFSTFLRGDSIRAWQQLKDAAEAALSQLSANSISQLNWLNDTLAPLFSALGGIWNAHVKPVWDDIAPYVERVWQSVQTISQALPETLGAIFDATTALVAELFQEMGHGWLGLKNAWDAIEPFVRGVFNAVFDVIDTVFLALRPLFEALAHFLQRDFTAAWLSTKEAITVIWDGLRQALASIGTGIIDALTPLGNYLNNWGAGMLQAGADAITNLTRGITAGLESLRQAASNILTTITDALANLPAELLALGQQAMTSIGDGLSSGMASVQNKVAGFFSNLNPFARGQDVGADISAGMVQGVEANAANLANAAQVNLVDNTLETVRDGFEIRSPSKVMEALFGYVAQGAIEGFSSGVILGHMQGFVDESINLFDGLSTELKTIFANRYEYERAIGNISRDEHLANLQKVMSDMEAHGQAYTDEYMSIFREVQGILAEQNREREQAEQNAVKQAEQAAKEQAKIAEEAAREQARIAEEAAKEAEKAAKEAAERIQEIAKNQLAFELETGIISKEQHLANLQEQLTNLEAHGQKFTDAWQGIWKEVVGLQKEASDTAKKLAEDAAKEAERIAKEQAQLAEQAAKDAEKLAEQAAERAREIAKNRYSYELEQGAISKVQHLANLQAQLADLETHGNQYTDEWQAIWQQIIAIQDDAAKTSKQIAENMYAYQREVGVIGDDQHLINLYNQMRALEAEGQKFSDAWDAIWDEIRAIEQANADAAKEIADNRYQYELEQGKISLREHITNLKEQLRGEQEHSDAWLAIKKSLAEAEAKERENRLEANRAAHEFALAEVKAFEAARLAVQQEVAKKADDIEAAHYKRFLSRLDAQRAADAEAAQKRLAQLKDETDRALAIGRGYIDTLDKLRYDSIDRDIAARGAASEQIRGIEQSHLAHFLARLDKERAADEIAYTERKERLKDALGYSLDVNYAHIDTLAKLRDLAIASDEAAAKTSLESQAAIKNAHRLRDVARMDEQKALMEAAETAALVAVAEAQTQIDQIRASHHARALARMDEAQQRAEVEAIAAYELASRKAEAEAYHQERIRREYLATFNMFGQGLSTAASLADGFAQDVLSASSSVVSGLGAIVTAGGDAATAVAGLNQVIAGLNQVLSSESEPNMLALAQGAATAAAEIAGLAFGIPGLGQVLQGLIGIFDSLNGAVADVVGQPVADFLSVLMGGLPGLFAVLNRAAREAEALREHYEAMADAIQQRNEDMVTSSEDWAASLKNAFKNLWGELNDGQSWVMLDEASADIFGMSIIHLDESKKQLLAKILSVRDEVKGILSGIGDAGDMFSYLGEFRGQDYLDSLSIFAGQYVAEIQGLEQQLRDIELSGAAINTDELERQLANTVERLRYWAAEFQAASSFINDAFLDGLNSLADGATLADVGKKLDESFDKYFIQMINQMVVEAVSASVNLAARMADIKIMMQEALETGDWSKVRAAIAQLKTDAQAAFTEAAAAAQDGLSGALNVDISGLENAAQAMSEQAVTISEAMSEQQQVAIDSTKLMAEAIVTQTSTLEAAIAAQTSTVTALSATDARFVQAIDKFRVDGLEVRLDRLISIMSQKDDKIIILDNDNRLAGYL